MRKNSLGSASNPGFEGVKEGKFYVFEGHILYRQGAEIFAISSDDLEQDAPNAVDGFKELQLGVVHQPLEDLSRETLSSLRRRLADL